MLIKQPPKLIIVRTSSWLLALFVAHDDLAASIHILERHRDKQFSLVRFGSILSFQVDLIALLVQQLNLLLRAS